MALIRKWASEHHLGRPVGACASTYVSYRERADGTWYDDPEQCPAAPLLRLGVYLINDLVRIFVPASSVSVLQSRIFTERPTADNAAAAILFESGALATVYASFCVHDGNHYRNQLQVHYENGTIMRNVGTERPTDDATQMGVIQSVDNRGVLIESARVRNVSGLYDWNAFAEAVHGDAGVPEYNEDDVIEPMRIIEAMKRSATTQAAAACRRSLTTTPNEGEKQ
jgi:predicted dehydrogenase